MTNPNYIRQEWGDFAKLFPEWTPQERAAHRRAFYAGAVALYSTLMTNLTEGDEPQPKDEAMLEHMHDELEEFAKQLESGGGK